MGVASTVAGQILGGHEEPPAGDKQAGGGGLAGMAAGAAQAFLGHGGGGGETVGAATHEGAGAANAGLVDKLVGAWEASSGQKVRPSSGKRGQQGRLWKGLQGGRLQLRPPTAGQPLLSTNNTPRAPQFTGGEGQIDGLAGMAHNVLGTPIGREVLKVWLKQRFGF